jgi:hypothetical protein
MTWLTEIITLTPLFQTFITYIVMYRHELSRLFHPIYERRDDKDWRRVLSDLKLIPKQEKKDKERTVTVVIPVKVISLVVAVLIPTILVDVVITPVILASLPAFLNHTFLPVLIQALLQFIPAFIAMIGLARLWLGPIPVPPHKYALPQKRPGSLLRHLQWEESAEE